MVNMVLEGKPKLKRKQESYLSGNQAELPPENHHGTTFSTVTYKGGDLVKSPNSMAFIWNRRYETNEELQQRFDLKDTFQRSGTHIGKAVVTEGTTGIYTV